MSRTVKLMGVLLVVVVALSVVGVVVVAAQDSDSPPGAFGFGRRGHGGGMLDVEYEAIHEAIANALGLSVSDFEAARAAGATLYDLAAQQGVDIAVIREAMEIARADAIDKAVADGTITAEEAEWLQSRGMGPGSNLGQGWGQRGPGGPGQGFGSGLVDSNVMHQAIADALGLSVEEFEAARDAGTTLYDLAAERGVDLAVVREAMLTVRTDAINAALAEGTITQEEADWLLSRPGPGAGSGYGQGGFHGGPGMQGRGAGDCTGPIGGGQAGGRGGARGGGPGLNNRGGNSAFNG